VDLVNEVIAQEGTAQAVAARLDMSLSAFLRGARHHGTLSAENCLRFAEAYQLNATHVLRLAGKGETAARMERLFGTARPPQLSTADRELLDKWAALAPDRRQHVQVVLDALLEVGGARSRRVG